MPSNRNAKISSFPETRDDGWHRFRDGQAALREAIFDFLTLKMVLRDFYCIVLITSWCFWISFDAHNNVARAYGERTARLPGRTADCF